MRFSLQTILSHVALLVPSVDKSASYLTAQGFKCGEAETFESEGSKEVYVGDYQEQSGLLLLVEPNGDGPYQRAMSKRGPSLHHIGIDVLDMKEFLSEATKIGWQLHPISNSKVAWLFFKGMPLLEIHEKKILSNKPAKIYEIQFASQFKDQAILDWVLGKKTSYGDELSFILDGKKLCFSQIACLK